MKRNEYGDVTDERFEFINGRKNLYTEIERGIVGYTIILRRPHSSTYIHLESEDEAWDTINNHCDNYNKFVKQDESLGKYLSSNEGSWGR